jgi:uncharacterized damage-inducible protein DinB
MDRKLIDKFAACADVPARAIKGLSKEELNSLPVPETWSIQQIIVHLMDSHLIGTDRMKRIVAEDNPTLIGYDESKFAKNLHYDKMDAAMAAEAFRINQLLTAELFRQLPDSAFDRAGMHSERGRVTLGQLVKDYSGHVDHHMMFVREKRKLLGKPLDF